MMKKITLFFAAMTLAFTFSVNAQDTCATAIPVLEGTTTGTTITTGTGSAEMAPTGVDSAWFVFTATADGTITVDACGGGSDTDLSIGEGSCGSLTILGQNDDFCDLGDGNAYASSVTIPVVNGNDYYIEWSNEWEEGPFDWTIAYVVPLANDDCTDAIALACDDVVAFDTTTASLDASNNVMCGTEALSPDVWYTYTGDGSTAETITLSTCNDADYDTKIFVYSGVCGALVCEANNDDGAGCAGFSSEVEFVSDGSTTYYISVNGYTDGFGTSSGTGNLTITCAPAVTPPVNNLCSGALPLTYGVALTGDNTNATAAVANPSCDLFGVISDVWFSFEGPASGEATLLTTVGSTDNAWLAVYDACGGTELGCASGATIGGGDGIAGGKELQLTGLTDGATYYVQVWNDGASARRVEGTFDVTVFEGLLSTTDFDNELAFSYYPNPVNNNLALNAQKEIENVVVYNMLGQQVLNSKPNAVNTDVNMSELQSGAYFVKVTIEGVTETVRVLKN